MDVSSAVLRIGNSMCQIQGVSPKTLKALRNATSYQHKTGRNIKTKKGKFIPEILTEYLMDGRGEFPTGILYVVEDTLHAAGIDYKTNDTRNRPKLNQVGVDTLYEKREFPPYPEQLEAAAAAVEHGRGIIVGPTGVGKSAIAALVCDAFRVRTLIVVPSLNLKDQLTASLRDAFGRDTVGPLRKDGNPEYWISVENVDALDPQHKPKGVDLVIIDEFHHSAAKTYRTLNQVAWTEVYFKIGLTATPFRSNDDERLLLESVLSHEIYRIEYELAVEKGYIAPLEVYYFDLPEVKTLGGSWQSVYKKLVVEREDRNQLIGQLARDLDAQGFSTLVLTKQIEHGKRLQDLVGAPFAEGANQMNRELIQDFNDRVAHVLIGTVGVIGEGVDTKPAEYVILAGGGKSKNQFMQNVGRVFRRYPGKESGKVIMFRDCSHKWLLDHFNSCVRYLKEEYGIVPTKIEI